MNPLPQIQGLTRVCAATGQSLGPGDAYHAVLVEDNGQFVRRDYALSAWPGPPEGAIAHWQARVPVQEPKRRLTINDELLLECVVRLADTTEPAKLNFRYVVALLLLRADGALLLEERPPEGLWGGLASPPMFASEAEALAWCDENVGRLSAVRRLPAYAHAFTHFDFTLYPVVVDVDAACELEGHRWFDPARPARIGLSKPAVDLMRAKRRPDGRWPLDRVHPGRIHFAFEDGVGEPSRWNTLRALRVLRWWDGAPA